jgi:hypothetical protein
VFRHKNRKENCGNAKSNNSYDDREKISRQRWRSRRRHIRKRKERYAFHRRACIPETAMPKAIADRTSGERAARPVASQSANADAAMVMAMLAATKAGAWIM